jgi:acyl carrier protein
LDANDDRLMRCFASTFPSASRDEIRSATLEAMPGWDSLRGVTLLAVLDEEFGLQIDLDQLLELGTFGALNRYLTERGTPSKAGE